MIPSACRQRFTDMPSRSDVSHHKEIRGTARRIHDGPYRERARENKKDWPAEREIPQTGLDAHHGHAVGQAEAIRAADHHCPSCPVLCTCVLLACSAHVM
jgi:hypothetical protein